MKKYKIITLGCKVNQYESDGISQELDQKGWEKAKPLEKVDAVIVNTCAVTSKAGMQSRQAVRKLVRENPDARVIVTGCHVQTDPDAIKNIDQVDAIVCHKEKTHIADHIRSICDNGHAPAFAPVDHSRANTFNSFDQAVSGSMTRAYLKIQDGCNAFCTYCIVPYARGGSVSMPEDQVFEHLTQLADKGYKEVILTGIHTGLYGVDFKKKSSLASLLGKIDKRRPVYRVRLSSIEPGEITDDLIELAMPDHVLCNHFHIPLQSGDDQILKLMKRPYRSVFFADVIEKIVSKIPHVSIGVDTLIGFPSETDQQFQHTYDLIKNLPVAYLHVFPFSRRKGTPAYDFKPQIDPEVIKERCRKMRELDAEKRKTFITSNLNIKAEGLVQHKRDRQTGLLKAVTSNYLSVLLEGDQDYQGKILDLIPEQCDSDLNLFGKTINTSEALR